MTQIGPKNPLWRVEWGFRGVLTVWSWSPLLHSSPNLCNISPPFPLLSGLVHVEVQLEVGGQGNRGLLSHVYILVEVGGSIMVNYTQHTASKTVTQHLLELPGWLWIISVNILFRANFSNLRNSLWKGCILCWSSSKLGQFICKRHHISKSQTYHNSLSCVSLK